MPRAKQRKPALVAVKLDAETAALLDTLPNKSEFIRAAIRGRMDVLCPLCGGTGVRPAVPVERLGGRHLHVLPHVRCGDCGHDSPVVSEFEPGQADRATLLREVNRLRTFLSYGDYFCATCYGRSVPCDRCGHRIPGSGPARDQHACRA